MLAAERCFDGAIGGGFVDDLDFFSAASNVSDAGPGRLRNIGPSYSGSRVKARPDEGLNSNCRDSSLH